MYPISQPTRQLAYAPTPYAPYTPNPLSTTISLDEEVKLPNSSSERDILDSLAEIYSILIALEGLEKAFNKDSVTDAEYTELCSRLIKQYKGNLSDDRVLAQFKDSDHFRAEWNVDCPRAAERVKVGLPATMINTAGGGGGSTQGVAAPSKGQSANNQSTQLAILATENFITFLDALRLGIGSKDQLHPLLSEVIQSANKVTEMDFEGRANIIKWLIRLNSMKAHEELNDGERRECEFEIDSAYRGFKGVVI